MAIIVDIDGTVADCKGIRDPFDATKVNLDKPIHEIIELVKMYHRNGYKIIFMSGRSDICQYETMSWLVDNGLPVHELFMRKEGDWRPDAVVKEELFFEHVADKYNVKLAIDDRNQVTARWRSIGLKVLQVDDGAF